MTTTAAVAACLMLAAQTYEVPPAVLLGILEVEGGRIGQEVGPNTNGSYDLGPMQINTLWIPELAEHWGVSHGQARSWVRDDACVNIGVAAWILRGRIERTGTLAGGIAHYHSATPHLGQRYAGKVVTAIRRMVGRATGSQPPGRPIPAAAQAPASRAATTPVTRTAQPAPQRQPRATGRLIRVAPVQDQPSAATQVQQAESPRSRGRTQVQVQR